MNAIIVNFKNSVPTEQTSEFFKVLFGYFLQNLNLWVDEYDKVYILDSSWNFNPQEQTALKDATQGKGEILETNPNSPYMQAFKEALPLIRADRAIFLHDDTYIYKKGFIKNIFDNLEKYQIVSAFEKIGTLTERINEKWPVMNGYSNFATALFGFQIDVLKPFRDFEDEASEIYDDGEYIPKLDYTTKLGDWVETLGRFTIRILGNGATVLQIKQDKSDIYFGLSPEVPVNTVAEWHHSRNEIAIAHQLTNKYYGWLDKYKESLEQTYLIENLRKLAWYWVANKNPYFTVDENKLFEVVADAKVDRYEWLDYLEKFKRFYSLE